ncbi:MAG TPA: hypothetical protein VN317_08710 [Candidatus Methanoperedens sp.]|nr:hypothetical protein [Candidatus Methanoperedens sp.]
MKVKAPVSLAIAVLLGLSCWSGALAQAQTPVVKQIPWTLKTPSLATADFMVSRALSYSNTGAPVAWFEQGTESFLLGNATILIGKYKDLTSLDFSKQLWLTIKAKKSDGTWVTIAKNQRVALWSFYSMWSTSADSATNASHSDTADAASVATTATSATTCSNWVAVSCPDGQCLKGFNAAGAPTCVPCSSGGGGGTPTSIPFDQTNWTGHRWSQNNDAGAWFPAVSAGVATYNSTDVAVGQTMSTATLSRDQTVSFEVNLSLSSGGNPDHGYFGFSTGYVGYNTSPLVAVEFSTDGNAYLNSKSGSGPLRGVLLGSYTKSAWIPVTMRLTPGGDFVVTINGANSSNNVSSTFSPTTFNIVITEWDTVDGFQVRNLTIQ